MKGANTLLDSRDFLKTVGVATGAEALTKTVPADLVAAPTANEVARADTSNLDVGKEPKLTVVTVTSHCDWAWTYSRAWHEYLSAILTYQYMMTLLSG